MILRARPDILGNRCGENTSRRMKARESGLLEAHVVCEAKAFHGLPKFETWSYKIRGLSEMGTRGQAQFAPKDVLGADYSSGSFVIQQ